MNSGDKIQETGTASWRDFWSAVRGYLLRAFFICLCGVSLENMDQAIFSFVLPQITKEFGWTVIERGQYLALTFTLAGLSIAGLGEPQVIRRHDTEVAVVVSITEWRRINGKQESLVEFLQKSPLDEIIPYLDRPQDLPREVSFE